MTAAAGFAAWAGAAVIVLADGRRGLAAGVGLVAVGFAALAWTAGLWLEGAILLVGAAVSVFQLLRAGPKEWGLMPPGSTPRLILAVVGGILSLWVAASVTTGPGAALRFASLAVLGLMAGRILQSEGGVAVLSAAAGLALALAGASGLAPNGGGLAPYLVGAIIAAGALLLPTAESRAA
ncbi:MAG TPA: hypothetical protein VF956_01535 [Candidatus Dormibacteraeota bacterium]